MLLDDRPTPAKLWHAGTLTYTTGGLVVLFCWLLWGDFAYALKDRSVQNVVQVMIKQYGATDLVMGAFLVALPALFGVVVGPAVSFRSDRTRTRWGRRIPYLIIATPIATLAMFGLGMTPQLGGALAHSGLSGNRSVLVLAGIFWALFDISTVVANTLFNALINDVVPRAVIGRFFGYFRILSLGVGAFFNHKLFGLAQAHYFGIFASLGLIYGLGFSLMCLMVREGEYPPPPDLAESEQPGLLNAATLYIKECFEQPYYLLLIVGFTLANLALIPVNLFNIPFADALQMSHGRFGDLLSLTYIISICMAYPLGALADKFHPLRLAILTMVAYAGITLWGGMYALNTSSFSIALVGHGVLSGFFYTVTASLTQRLFPRSRFAQFFSAYWMTYSVSLVIVGPIVGQFLDFSGHVYRYAYLMSSGLAVMSVLCLLEVYRRFNTFGGVAAYVAPE